MTMAWVAVGAAVLGAGASVYGANKQAKGAQKAGQINLDMFNTLNKQQQPYIQSGYGALSKLNTLLGTSPNPNRQLPVMGQAYRPTAGGGVEPIAQNTPASSWNVPEKNMPNLQLRRVLALRAQNGDRQAQGILQGMI